MSRQDYRDLRSAPKPLNSVSASRALDSDKEKSKDRAAWFKFVIVPPSTPEITRMYVVRLHPDVNLFILEPRSPYAGLMLFVVKFSSMNDAFACNGFNFTFNSCRVSPLAIQQ